MAKHYETATIFGGTGFLGRQIVRQLAKRGILVKVATRVPESAYFLKPYGAPGQITPVQCNYHSAESIDGAIKGADFVINCVGILFERGKNQTFQYLHTDLPAIIASACQQNNVPRLVHISALGIENATSKYAETKLEGEKAVLENFPTATILRPGIMFGPGDHFFNKFAEIARYLPALPLIGGGKTQLQPVYVDDVAKGAMAALDKPQAQGQIYELGGPEILSFKEIYKRLFHYSGRRRALFNLPFWAAKIDAFFLNFLPNPPITIDQVKSLKTDSIVKNGALTFKDLEITPNALSIILPTYLHDYRWGGRFGDIQET